MGELLKFPVEASRLGYQRVHKRCRAGENPDQLQLFAPPPAQVLDFPPEGGRFAQALLFDERGDARAADLYRKAIAEGDCVADAYCNLGIVESVRGNTTNAFDCFTASLQHDPRHAEAHYNLGNLYFEVNDFRLAQVHYQMAGEVSPSFANAYFNLALVQVINDDLAAAVAALRKYQALVSAEDARLAGELLRSLGKSLSAARNARSGRE